MRNLLAAFLVTTLLATQIKAIDQDFEQFDSVTFGNILKCKACSVGLNKLDSFLEKPKVHGTIMKIA